MLDTSYKHSAFTPPLSAMRIGLFWLLLALANSIPTKNEKIYSCRIEYGTTLYFDYPEVHSFVARDAYKYKRTEKFVRDRHRKNDSDSKPIALFLSKSGKVVDFVFLKPFTR